MLANLYDDVWMRRGVSLLWDLDALNKVCKPRQVASLRHLLKLQSLGWPENDLGLIDETTLVIAGLEVAIDALPPDAAIDVLTRFDRPDGPNWLCTQSAMFSE